MRKYIASTALILCSASFLLYASSRAGKNQISEKITSSSDKVSSQLGGVPKTVVSPKLKANYAKIPLSFEPNVGQTGPQAKFLAHGDGYTLFLSSDQAVVKLGNGSAKRAAALNAKRSNHSTNGAEGTVLRMQLVGAAKAQIHGQDQLPGKSNYFIGNSQNWHTDIPTFRQVQEQQVYPGIDLVYYGTQRQLEYDFVVAPGANPRKIEWNIEGARNLSINSSGEVVIRTGSSDVILRKPVAYQLSGNEKHYVGAKYVQDGARGVSFSVENYDPSQTLVIDPILSYSTYLGGSGIDSANGIAVAPDGTAFVAGSTNSTDFPTAHPLQPNDGGGNDFPLDAFVAKMSADGSTLLYSTYLGGTSQDSANAIAVDTAGNAYVVGLTSSGNFPVTFGALNTECGSDSKCGASLNNGGLLVSNGFLTKLNPAGSAIIYSTFIGEYENVDAYGVAVDANQIAYVTGSVDPYIIPTSSSNNTGISLAGAPAGIVENAGGTSATVTTSAPSGVQIGQYVTISGVLNTAMLPVPSLDGSAFVTAIVSANSFVVDLAAPAGTTGGSGTVVLGPPPFPNTTGQVGVNGSSDAFIVKVSVTGTTAQFATYVGGGGEDVGYGIAVDGAANAYVTGVTYSPNFPVTAGAFQPAYGGAGDAFVAQVNTTTSVTTYASYLGGTGLDQGKGIAVDGAGNVYVAGGSASAGLPTTGLAYMGEGDAFVAKFNPAAAGAGSLVYFTYLGGSLADTANGVGVDTAGDAYVTGATVSTNFPTTTTGFQGAYGGGNDDAFVAEVNPGGTGLVYSSYLGGTNTDIGYAIAVDTTGAAYVAGQTCSTDFTVNNGVQAGASGNCDAFISRVAILNGIELNPSTLSFNAQSLNTTSQTETVTVTNGDTPVTISNIAVTGANPADFKETNNCPTTLAAGAKCVISVTFTPSASGVRKAAITITDSAPGSPQTIPLTGQTSTLMLSASSLTFGNTAVGSTSAAESITATNTGNTPITFTSITASGDFKETDNCGVALQPGTNCIINVTFTPSANGSQVGALTLNDNAPGSPQIVTLTGTGFFQNSDFTLTAVSPSATVSAGHYATFGILVGSIAGFSDPVNLSCSGLPVGASCSFSSNPVTPTSAGGGAQVTVTVSTSARTMVPPSPASKPDPRKPFGNLGLMMLMLAIMLAMIVTLNLEALRGRRATVALGFALLLTTFTVACSGGSQVGGGSGTPAGTYQISVVGTSGSSTHTVTVTLGVK